MGIATQTSDGLKFSTTYMYVKNSSGTTLAAISSGGNLGIGTNNPAQKLHVNGGQIRVNQGTSAVAMGEYSNGAVIWLDGANGDFAGGDYFNIKADNYNKMTFGYAGGDSVYLTHDGKLGVGVSPNHPLDVYRASGGCTVQFSANLSNAYEGSTLKLKGGNLATNKIMLGDVSDEDIGAINYANNGNTMTFDVNAATRLTIESGGNIGIGTTDPAAKLHVSNSASSGGTFKFTDGSSRTLMDLGGGNLSWNAGTVFGAGSWAGTADHEFRTLGTTRDAVYISGPTSGTKNALKVDGSRSYFGGSVGIGTNPTTKLMVYSSSGNVLTLLGQSASNVFNVGATGVTQISGATGNSVLVVSNSGSGAYMDIGSGALFVKKDGSVGIGTNNPTYTLDVETASEIVASFVSTDNKAAINISDDDTAVYVSAENSKGSFGFNVGTHANNLNIDSSGNVGIGTNTPSQKLHVVGTTFIDATETTGGLTVKATSNANITLQAAQNTAYNAVLAAHYNWTTPMTLSGYGATVLAMNSGIQKTLLYANNAEQIRITTTGVGIGLGGSDPTTKLHVGGGTKIEGPLAGVLNSSITRIENFILDTKGEDAPVINHQLNNDLALLRVKGNTVTYSGLSQNPGDSETDRFFEANSYFGDVLASEISNASTGFTITLNSLPRNLTYTTRVGISFATPSWRCSYVKIEVYRAGSWNTIREETSNSSATVYQYYNTGSSAITKIRYTLKTPVTTSLRIVSLFAFNYNSTGATGYYLSQAGGSVYGNVGIGTASPSAKLHIQSDGSHDEGAEIVLRHSNNNSTDVVSTISFQNNGGQVAMIQGGTTGANNTGYISFFTDSTGTSGERMRIQGNGYVGIGTATAYSPLQVYSSDDQKILLSGSANPYIRWQNGGSNRAYIQWIEGNSALTFVNSSGDNFDFLPHDSTGALALRLKGNDSDIWGYVYAYEGNSAAHEVGFLDGDGAWAARHIKDTSWDFRINNSSKMTINSSGTVAVGGTTLLTNEGIMLNRSGGAGYLAFYDGSGGAKWNIQRNSGVGNCLRIHAYNNTSQVFKVTKNYNSTDGFSILLDSGSVGVGVIGNPYKTLQVSYVSTSTNVTLEGLSGGVAGKGLLIYNSQASNNVYANIDFRANNADGRIAYQYQSATNVGDFHFITDNTGSPQSMMVIKNDGRIGMGTVSPNARLHVYRPAGTVPGLLLDSNRDGARLNFNYSSSATTFGEIGMTHYGSSGDCRIWMGANLNSNSSSHSGPAVGVAGTGASSWYTVWNTQTAQDFYGIYRRSPSPSSSYENYFRIKSDGNVGINTTNPTDRLHVRSVQSAGNGSGSNLATLSLETYNSNSDDHGSYVKCKNYGGGGGGPDWKIGGMEGYWTTNKVASIDFITGDDWYNPGNKDEGEIAFTVYNNTGSGSTAIEAMRIHQTGNIGIGSTNPGSKLTVNGSFSASSKSFLIDHPTKENKKLEHGCLEGPEFGVYHRGTTQSNTITLPDYWSGLVREDTVTVQLTPRGGFQHLYVVSTSLSQIVIGAADGETIDCFYTIYGERADIDSLVVEKDV